MKIISKFSDYYDCGISYGVDPKVRYERKTDTLFDVEESLHDSRLYGFQTSYSEGFLLDAEEKVGIHYIGFCGKIYTIAKLEVGRDVEYFCTYDQLLKAISKTKLLKNAHQQEKAWKVRAFNDVMRKIRINIGSVSFNEEIFSKFGVPVFHSTESGRYGRRLRKVVLNPCLKDMKFASLVDPYTAFQEISMFISNQLADVEVPVVISDKDLIDAKGFNDKSFKKRGN